MTAAYLQLMLYVLLLVSPLVIGAAIGDRIVKRGEYHPRNERKG